MVSLTIKLEPELKAEVEAEARLTGRSVSDVVRESLRKRKRARRNELSLFDRVKDLCGTVESGKPDLATNRKHLEGFGSWRR
ncbi:MAG: ribbon-helix-helix protein, CopG family [Verrucomicrobia bacterium]|nr:ribbon-helix-helix protein, CopG family [Verrucomicrobiota bacterium]